MLDRRHALKGIAGLAGLGGLAALADRGTAQSHTGDAQLLMFDDPGCGYCRQWHREIGAAYRNSTEGRRAPLRIVQIRDRRPADITLASPVRATPTFVLVQDGREMGRITGYGGPDFFWSMLQPLMRKLQTGQAA